MIMCFLTKVTAKKVKWIAALWNSSAHLGLIRKVRGVPGKWFCHLLSATPRERHWHTGSDTETTLDLMCVEVILFTSELGMPKFLRKV